MSIREEGNRKNTNGNRLNSALDLNEKLFFENQIVPVWASTKVAAEILGITPNALRIRKCRGEIECRYFGRNLRFNLNDLHRLFRTKREE